MKESKQIMKAVKVIRLSYSLEHDFIIVQIFSVDVSDQQRNIRITDGISNLQDKCRVKLSRLNFVHL